jgi:hypothetical protein
LLQQLVEATGRADDERGPSTLRIGQLPIKATVAELCAHLDRFGLAGQYDYVHFLANSKRRVHRDYAFVVFANPEQCTRCACVLVGTQLPDHLDSKKTIGVTMAATQGVLANLHAQQDTCRTWFSDEDSEFLPWLRQGGRMVPCCEALNIQARAPP